jgi:hypothetical protein
MSQRGTRKGLLPYRAYPARLPNLPHHSHHHL